MSLSVKNMLGGSGQQKFPYVWEKYEDIVTPNGYASVKEEVGNTKVLIDSTVTTTPYYLTYSNSSDYIFNPTIGEYVLRSSTRYSMTSATQNFNGSMKVLVGDTKTGMKMIGGNSSGNNITFSVMADGLYVSYASIYTSEEKFDTKRVYVGDVISTDANAYPDDGMQDGYYYKRKNKPPYVWGRYNAKASHDVKTSTVTYSVSDTTSESIKYYDASSFTTSDGVFYLESPTEHTIGLNSYDTIPSNKYFIIGNSNGTLMFRGSSTNLDTRIVNNTSTGITVTTASVKPFEIYTIKYIYSFLEYITDKDSNKYPNGEMADDGFFYRSCNEGVHTWFKNEAISEFVDFGETIHKMENGIATPSIVYNGKLYFFNSYDYLFYSFDGETVKQVGVNPAENYFGSLKLAVYNGEMYLVGCQYYATTNGTWKWDGNTWVKITDAPYITYGDHVLIEYKGYLRCISSGHNNYTSYHKKFDGTSWSDDEFAVPSPVCYGGVPFVYDGVLHILGGGNDSTGVYYDRTTTDGKTWTNKVTYYWYKTSTTAIFQDDNYVYAIHGTDVSGNNPSIARYDGTSWETIPFENLTSAITSLNHPTLFIKNGIKYLFPNINSSLYSDTTFYKCGNLIDTVVSDDEDAYPVDGFLNGYYYKSGGGAIDIGAMGFTQYEMGEFTPTSSEYLHTITHSLGVIPRIAIITATNGIPSSGNYTITYLTYIVTSSGDAYYYVTSGNTSNKWRRSTSSSGSTWTKTTAPVGPANYSDNFTAGVTYAYLLFA